ncbi:hypothetical protein TGAM01_v207703 [Trichoderma gamsii]|uniref:Uncharacterized protein n=1 Tax=Trichoderma gamsii TaxID=398673 RepID=A0A2P4ZGQ2_9HYPO|nr:hypothetical protein TGAM01_v207703 [Trichoderma gamsii]PON23469.1 hypothetical protein TGAM01_v207703 [Trichoderma gamsii]
MRFRLICNSRLVTFTVPFLSFELGTGAVEIRPPDQDPAARLWQDKTFLGFSR